MFTLGLLERQHPYANSTVDRVLDALDPATKKSIVEFGAARNSSRPSRARLRSLQLEADQAKPAKRRWRREGGADRARPKTQHTFSGAQAEARTHTRQRHRRERRSFSTP